MTEVETLRDELEKSNTERDRYRQLYMDMLARCKLLERGIVAGRKAERFTGDASQQLSMQVLGALLTRSEEPAADAEDDSGPLDLAEEEDDADDAAPELGGDSPEPRRRPRGRRKLPEALPRVDVEVVPPEVQQLGLDAFVRIGEVVSEVVERRPASLVAVRVVRPKFVRKDALDAAGTDEDAPEVPPVVIAEPPERPIERGLAGPGLLAATIVQRWGDHLPANRQEAIYAREGLPLARSTICSWHQRLADLVDPLVQAMREDAFRAPYLCVDATGVLVQAKEQCHKAHFWVVVAPGRHVLYGFSHKHDSEAVDRLLAGYKGYLVADAHAVYDHLYRDGTVVESACWAHCRRYFFKALGSEPDLAGHALGLIKVLFKIEKTLTTATRKKREAARTKQSRPIVDAFFDWCDQQARSALEGTPLAAALTYARNQRTALERFLSDGRLPIHNNISEAALRREAVGRKNWIFVGSDDGAHANTVFVSLLASCQMHDVEPLGYLRDLLCLLPSWPSSRVLELAPAYWKETLKQQETQQRLAANVFRRIALGEHPGSE